MSHAQRFAEPVNRTDLSVDPSDYFGVDPEETENAEIFGIEPSGPEEDLYRVSYLFLLVFGNDNSPTDYGGMQLRAETTLWLSEGELPTRLTKIIQRTAHRAAHLFDSSIETPAYGPAAAGGWGDGYLDGFDPQENGYDYENWEVERISGQEARTHGTPGKINWTTEIYNEVEETRYAQLAGKASGIADPWTLRTTTEEGKESVSVAPHKWEIGFEDNWGDYYLRPPGRTDAASRYVSGAGASKTVYLNGKKIGGIGPKGRVRLNPKYSTKDGKTYGDNWSRFGIIEETAATPQAIRKGGVAYLVGEDEGGIYLRTKRALPDGYRAVDPDEVSPDLEAQAGREGRTIHLLGLIDPDDPLPCECREDREIIDKMGKSDPTYRHAVGDLFRWPGYREIKPGHIGSAADVEFEADKWIDDREDPNR